MTASCTLDLQQITTVDDLTLVVQRSNIGICVEVRTTRGEMAGGCGGVDFDTPLSVAEGLIGDTAYLSGWTSPDTAEVVITFPNGDQVSVTEFVRAEGYDVLFFLTTNLASTPREPGLQATAFDTAGNEVGSVTYASPQP